MDGVKILAAIHNHTPTPRASENSSNFLTSKRTNRPVQTSSVFEKIGMKLTKILFKNDYCNYPNTGHLNNTRLFGVCLILKSSANLSDKAERSNFELEFK